MSFIAIGCDVSKGRCDIAIINESGTLLMGSGGYDDNRRDHERLRGVLMDLRDRHPEAEIVVGLEATGGLERNWIAFFRAEKRWEKFRLHRINPLALKRYLAADLHRAVTDPSAAQGIAQFLLERCRYKQPIVPVADGTVNLYRMLRSAIEHRTELKQQFLTLLVSTHAELVQYARSKLPAWVVAVVARYPTAKHLARAKPSALDRIAFVDLERAEHLVADAKATVSSLVDDGAAETMRFLVRQMRDLEVSIEMYRAKLEALLADDERIRQLTTIPGVATWSAISILLEIGDIARFATVKHLIAWAGLDPHEDCSGDGVIRRGISHRGNSNLRAMLYPLAMACSQHNPVIRAFYSRLLQAGKCKQVALVACMAKLLRIIYGLLTSGRDFDATYEVTRAERRAQAQQETRSAEPTRTAAALPVTLDAPITKREAKRRRARSNDNAAAPCPTVCEVEPQTGSGATAPPVSPNPGPRQSRLVST